MALSALVLPVVGSAPAVPNPPARSLSFYHTHTGESLSVTYYRDGGYVPEALERLNRFLRDFRTEEQIEMDPSVFDILHEILEITQSEAPFEVISAYRSPATNEMLRGRSGGVAKNSQHLRGKAIDVRLADVELEKLRDVALELKLGGVGYYPGSNFVHVDTGRVRRW